MRSLPWLTLGPLLLSGALRSPGTLGVPGSILGSTSTPGPPGEPGASFCSSTVNSTGRPAVMSAAGSARLSDNDLVLFAGPVPVQPGLFFSGTTQAGGGSGVPFGNGLLCAEGAIVRYGPPALPGSQYAERRIDMASEACCPGTRHFQYWFRDPAAGGAFFDTSDGYTIDIVP